MQTQSRAAGGLGASISRPGAWVCSLPAAGSLPAIARWALSRAHLREAVGCPAPAGKELCEGHPQRPGCFWGCLLKFIMCFFVFISCSSLVMFNLTKSAQRQIGCWEQRAPSIRTAHLSQMVQAYLLCSSRLKNHCKKSLQKARNKGKSRKEITYYVGDEEVVAQEAVVQHGGNNTLQPSVAPVRALWTHLDEEREMAGPGENKHKPDIFRSQNSPMAGCLGSWCGQTGVSSTTRHLPQQPQPWVPAFPKPKAPRTL